MRPAGEVGRVRPDTVLRLSVALRAAFQRTDRNAGMECVRGVVEDSRQLASNPAGPSGEEGVRAGRGARLPGGRES